MSGQSVLQPTYALITTHSHSSWLHMLVQIKHFDPNTCILSKQRLLHSSTRIDQDYVVPSHGGDLWLWSHFNCCCCLLPASLIDSSCCGKYQLPRSRPAPYCTGNGNSLPQKKMISRVEKWKAGREGSWGSSKSTQRLQPQETSSEAAVGHCKVRCWKEFEGRHWCPVRPTPGISTKKY